MALRRRSVNRLPAPPSATNEMILTERLSQAVLSGRRAAAPAGTGVSRNNFLAFSHPPLIVSTIQRLMDMIGVTPLPAPIKNLFEDG
jgi:hypothetical protein